MYDMPARAKGNISCQLSHFVDHSHQSLVSCFYWSAPFVARMSCGAAIDNKWWCWIFHCVVRFLPIQKNESELKSSEWVLFNTRVERAILSRTFWLECIQQDKIHSSSFSPPAICQPMLSSPSDRHGCNTERIVNLSEWTRWWLIPTSSLISLSSSPGRSPHQPSPSRGIREKME